MSEDVFQFHEIEYFLLSDRLIHAWVDPMTQLDDDLLDHQIAVEVGWVHLGLVIFRLGYDGLLIVALLFKPFMQQSVLYKD